MSRRRILAVTLLAVIGIAATSAADMPIKLVWNATASVSSNVVLPKRNAPKRKEDAGRARI